MMSHGNPALGFGVDVHMEETEKSIIKNDGFFPDVDLLTLVQDAQVVPGVTNAKLIKSVVAAMLDVNNQLRTWKAQHVLAGYDQLQAIPAQEVDECSVLVQSYCRAIHETVDADLSEKYLNYDTTATGDKEAQALLERIGTARRNAFGAIRFILAYEQQEQKPSSKLVVYVI